MPSVLNRPLFRQNGGEIAEPGQGFVKRATQGARRWDPLTNGEERRHRAQLDIYNNFTPEQKRHVGLLTETGLSVEDAIFEVWSEAKRAIGSDMLYRPPPPVAPMVSPEPMPPMPSGVTRGFPEPLPPMPPMVSPAPMPPMVSPAPMPPMVSPAPPPDFSEFNQGGPALAPQAMMAPPVGMPPMGMPPEAMMAPPMGIPPEAMGMPPQAMAAPPAGMPPQAMGMPAGISPEDEALLGGVAQLGEDYVHDMLSGLDTADTPESLINALRGNDLPLEARYNELAQLVGPEDAQATPESVLALVQPTLMLVDAGVGSLMPGVAGETEMMTESGAPTPMGEGVGNLMMAGAPPPDMMMANQVSPQLIWKGGPVVQRFQDGNGVKKNLTSETFSEFLQTSPLEEVDDLRTYVERTSPLVSELLMPRRSREQDLQLAFYQGLGKFGQRLASPEEGQRGLSFGAAVGAALPDIIAPVIETGKQQAVTEREMNAVALQLAAAERKGDIAAATTLTSSLSKYFSDKYQLQNIDGKLIAVNKRNPADFYVIGDFAKPTYKTVNEKVVEISPDGKATELADFSDTATGEKIWGASMPGLIAEFLAENKNNVIAWGEGTLQDPQLANKIESAIYEQARRSVDQAGNLQGFTVPPWMKNAIVAKYGEDEQRILFLTGSLGDITAQRGISEITNNDTLSDGGPVVQKFKDGMDVSSKGTYGVDPDLSRTGGDIISGRYNPELAAGVMLPIHSTANWIMGQMQDISMAKDRELPFQETAGAKIELNALKGATSRFFTEGADGGRTLSAEFENLQEEIGAMGGFSTDARLLLKLKQIRTAIQDKVAKHAHVIAVEDEVSKASPQTQRVGGGLGEEPLTQAKGQLGNAITKKAEGRDLLKEYDRAIIMLEGHLTGKRPSIPEILRSIEGP